MDVTFKKMANGLGADLITEAFMSCFSSDKHLKEWLDQQNKEEGYLDIAAKRYANKAESRFNFMRIFGMANPVPLRNIYTRVNILEKITASHRETIQELEKFFDHDRRSFGKARASAEGSAAVSKLEKSIILGKPGAGKTTFLKYIVLQALDGKLPKRRIPIFIGLKDWSDSKVSLLDYIVEQFDVCELPNSKWLLNRLLDNGRCLILLDGFDEVSIDIERVIKQIRGFSERFSLNQFVLSCRIAAYTYCFEEFVDLEIADFKLEQIERFINNWFGTDSIKARLCWKKLSEDKPIRELASTPLLLTMLCLAFDDTMEFPLNRAELYKEAIDALLKRWDASRSIKRDDIYRHLSNRRKESLFSRIAITTFESNQYFMPQRTLEKYIRDFIQHLPDTKESTLDVDSEVVLKAIEAQHGLFVERAKRIYSFSHLTFQEYFTSRFIVDNAEKGTLQTLIDNNLLSEKWREVFLITTGMLDEADDFLHSMKKKIDSLPSNKTVSSLLRQISLSITKRDELYSFFPNSGKTIPYKRARLLAFALQFGREYLLSLDRIGRLPSRFPSSQARSNTNDLSLSYGRAHEIATEFSSELDKSLLATMEHICPFARAFRGNNTNDASLLNAIQEAGNRYPVLREALDLALKRNLSEFITYLTATQLLVRCLQTECYISRPMRKSIMNGILFVP